jgi:hypothetical protein
MAAKKTAKKAKTEAPSKYKSSLAGPIYIDGVKAFSPLDLAKYELAQNKVQLTQQDMLLKQHELNQLKYNFEKAVGVLQMQAAETKAQQLEAERALAAIRAEVANVYEVDPEFMAYDDQTGRIRVLPKPGEEET